MKFKLSGFILAVIVLLISVYPLYQDESQFQDWFRAVKQDLSASAGEIWIKEPMINLNGLFQRILGKRIIEDASGSQVLKLNNGYITNVQQKIDVSPYAEKLKILRDDLEQLGIPLLFVQAPYKISKFDPQLPIGIQDYGNQNIDAFLEALDTFGIKYLDTRRAMVDQGIDQYDYFFKTDHHWTPQAGLWVALQIAEKLNQDFGFTIDLNKLDPARFSIELLPTSFLGSIGKRVGRYYAGLDNFQIIKPTYETSFEVFINDELPSRKGLFENTLQFAHLLEGNNYFTKNQYSFYSRGEQSETRIHNFLSENQPKILLIRDSFVSVVSPFLALGLSDLTTLDLRYYKKSSLMEYIQQEQPALVLFLYNPGAYYAEMFEFYKAHEK